MIRQLWDLWDRCRGYSFREAAGIEGGSAWGRRDRGDSPYPLPLGRVLVTPSAERALKAAGVPLQDLLRRHVRGDFGEITEEDRDQNERNAREGGQITSVYSISQALPFLPSQVMILSGAPEGAVVILLGE